ncbi:MAG: hypothetical protein WBQ69_09280 [Gallionella sp.]
MKTARKALNSIVVPLLAFTMIVNLASCGTILYPERKGQKPGHIDPAVAILDGVGLLFFIIPGVIAFAVDFSNNSIYLPRSHSSKFDSLQEYSQIRADKKLDAAAIQNIIRAETGTDISLEQANMKIVRLKSAADLDSEFSLYGTDNHIALTR